MKYYNDSKNGIYAKKTLDPQILSFDPELDSYFSEGHEFIFKIEESNSGLRYVLTRALKGETDQKGYYYKTLCMDLQGSINKAKAIVDGKKLYVEDMGFMKSPSPEYVDFQNWLKQLEAK